MILQKPYLRARAVAYAERWALSRNPLFYDFAGVGGDCTSFVSQAILAGSCTMNFTPTYGWYYRTSSDRAPAWSGVEFLYDFLVGVPAFAEANGGIGPYGREVTVTELSPGDVIQLADEAGDYYHTLMLTAVLPDELLVSAHTRDALNRPLSSYSYASARYIHIEGVRIELPDDGCFDGLIEGRELM